MAFTTNFWTSGNTNWLQIDYFGIFNELLATESVNWSKWTNVDKMDALKRWMCLDKVWKVAVGRDDRKFWFLWREFDIEIHFQVKLITFGSS